MCIASSIAKYTQPQPTFSKRKLLPEIVTWNSFAAYVTKLKADSEEVPVTAAVNKTEFCTRSHIVPLRDPLSPSELSSPLSAGMDDQNKVPVFNQVSCRFLIFCHTCSRNFAEHSNHAWVAAHLINMCAMKINIHAHPYIYSLGLNKNQGA